jgi:CASC3/Barentsz eIF4AIII binding
MNRRQKLEASDGQWTHDLHETVVHDNGQTFTPPSYSHYNNNNAGFTNGSAAVSLAPRSSPPNRSFSTTLIIGNVPVRVFLPGMETPVSFAAVRKRQHTRLPQHRPPLRRDKPVRISLPGIAPKYVLPAPERSFIFIPRALRPNQQSYRGRGRGGGYYGGRRPSLYPGSAYSPSISMSRRSSVREGMHSPAGSVLSRQAMVTGDKKPIVRLPPAVRPPGPPIAGAVIAGLPALPILPPNTAYRESRAGPITMHQPRPQKTVSLADIESPASFNFNLPQPQLEQPFHQQVPGMVAAPGYGPDGAYMHGRHPSHPSQPSGTPLSHIPERAIHAPPFQPYGVPAQPAYFAGGYPPGAAVYYPGEYPHYTPPAATFVPPPPPGHAPPSAGQPYILHHPPPPQPQAAPPHTTGGEQQGQPHMVAHEANGTVYFYDAQELYHPNAPYPASGGVVGMGGMMTPPGTTYYYPQSSGPVYYTAQ